jgi:maleate cis-trans isomerase
MTMENDTTGKITAILAAAVVLASASVASAQTVTVYAPYANSYYKQDGQFFAQARDEPRSSSRGLRSDVELGRRQMATGPSGNFGQSAGGSAS